MKKKFFISMLAMLFIICAISYSLTDYWGGGWIASSGLDTMPGTATGVSTFPGGYSFYCPGGGVCYTINGGWLDINEGIGSGGPGVDILRQ